jgi:long-chain acyl-CoA synthetase
LEQQYGISLDETAIQKVQTSADLQAVMQAKPELPTEHAARRTKQHVYPRWPWGGTVQALRGIFLEHVAIPLLRFLAKPAVRNAAKSLPSSPMLIISNHVTSYDVPFVLYGLPPRIRKRVAVAMSGEMILDWRYARNQGHWFLNWIAPLQYFLVTALFNIFPLPQYSGFRRSFAHAGDALDHGYHVLVFPEGKRSADGQLQPFKSGTGLLWKELGVPALPVHLHGLGQIKAQHERWFRTGNILVSVGEPLQLEAGSTPQELTEVLRHGVESLGRGLPPSRR